MCLANRSLVALLLGFLAASGAASDRPAVAAAADLKFALEEIARAFHQRGGGDVRISFGSSGNFYRKLAQGAPYEVYLSADESYVQRLAALGLTVDGGSLYALGRLALFAPAGSPLEPEAGLTGLQRLVNGGKVGRFAIANPEHAPYGRAAEEALRSTGLWAQIENVLVMGENAAQATQFATSGSTIGGIIPYSLALAPAVQARGHYTLLPQRLHAPLRQRMVLMRGAGDTARAFYEFLRSAQAREVFRRHGFELPHATVH